MTKKERDKQYHELHREYYLNYYKEYHRTPKGKFKQYCRELGHGKFLLTFEEFMKFWKKDCFYCGNKIGTIGLDRKDQSKDYIPDNIVPCCFPCNQMKSKLSIEEFLDRITIIYEHRIKNSKP